MQKTIFLILTWIAIGIVILASWRHYRRRREDKLQVLRAAAIEIFRSVKIESANATHALNGKTATIAKQDESYVDDEGVLTDYTLTLLVHNELNEYFLFISTQPKPYVKHVTHTNAQVLLKQTVPSEP